MGVNYKLYACGLSPRDEGSSFTTFINETNESGGHLFTNIYNTPPLNDHHIRCASLKPY